MNKKLHTSIAIVLFIIWLIILIFQVDNLDEIDSMLNTILVLVILLIVVPWERISNFKAAGIELSIYQGFKSAVDGYTDINSDAIIKILEKNKDKLPLINRSRVLWIEDRPRNIVGERRILRALGIEIIMGVPNVIDPSPIDALLDIDTDFDLIISDVQWRINEHKVSYGGIKYSLGLRLSENRPHLNKLPIIIYTGYQPSDIETIKKDISLGYHDKLYFTYSVEQLIEVAIKTLYEYRERPNKIGKKGAT